jgi:hypothetical protein
MEVIKRYSGIVLSDNYSKEYYSTKSCVHN